MAIKDLLEEPTSKVSLNTMSFIDQTKNRTFYMRFFIWIVRLSPLSSVLQTQLIHLNIVGDYPNFAQ